MINFTICTLELEIVVIVTKDENSQEKCIKNKMRREKLNHNQKAFKFFQGTE